MYGQLSSSSLPGQQTKSRLELRVSEELIPYTVHADQYTVKTMEGSFVQGIRVRANAAETSGQALVKARNNACTELRKSFPDNEFAIYTHLLRRSAPGRLENTGNTALDSAQAYSMAAAQTGQNDERQYTDEMYLWVVARQPGSQVRTVPELFHTVTQRLNDAERSILDKKLHRKLNEAVAQLMACMRADGCERLGVVANDDLEDGETFHLMTSGYLSEPMGVLGYLLNLEDRNYILPMRPISHLLMASRHIYRDDYFVLRREDGSRAFCSFVLIKESVDWTAPLLADEVSRLPFEMVITQSFQSDEKPHAYSAPIGLPHSRPGFTRNTIKPRDTAMQAADGVSEELTGMHHCTVLVYADDLTTLNQHCATLMAKLGEAGITAYRDEWNQKACLYAQLPGNFNESLMMNLRPRALWRRT